MKKYTYLYFILFTLTIVSCNKFLDVVPDNLPVIDDAFADRYNAEKYLFTCYSYMPYMSGISANPALASGDEIWFNKLHETDNGPRLSRGEQNSVNPVFDYWRGGYNLGGGSLYIGLRDCNTFLEKIGDVKGLSDYERTQWISEVTFLKAYYHYLLIRMYGPIQIIDKSIPVTASTNAIKAMRDPLDSCFNYVERLMNIAISNLPTDLSNTVTDLGRVTKPIAMAMKAEVLMTAASPLFNGNPNYTSYKNADGTNLFPTEFDANKWVKAATACKEAIDACTANGTSLYQMSDFSNPFPINDTTKYICALRNSVTESWGKELIWGYSINGGSHDLQYYACPRFYACVSTAPVGNIMSVTLKIAEQFYSNNGVPIEEDVNYDYNNRFKLQKGTSKDRFFVETNEQTVKLNYNREFRYYSSVSFDRDSWFGNGKIKSEADVYHIHNRLGDYGGIVDQYQFSVTGYFPKKLVNLGSELRDGTSFVVTPYAFPIMRLSDLYLYYAEALNETKAAPDASVTEYIDKVRNRAGLGGVVDSWRNFSSKPDKPTTKAGMREIIQRERLIELAFEGKRYWDLRRWLLSEQYLSQPVRGWNVNETDVANYYNIVTLFNQSFTQRDYLWPIPENEIVKNPKLVQNPGW